jgi:uncharacterized protein DUF4340
MIKKVFINPLFISFFLLFFFMAVYFYQNKPKKTSSVNLINSPVDSLCFNQSCLQKEDDIWWYQDKFPADSQKVNEIISALETINLDNLVSNNPQKFNQLGFSGDNPLIVRVGEITFELSTSLQNISYSLIKLGSDKVYKVAYLGSVNDLNQETYWQKQD